jgi:membrane-associated phospholipid phosphatase
MQETFSEADCGKDLDYGFPSGHAVGSNVYLLMFTLLSSQAHLKICHGKCFKAIGFTISGLIALGIIASRHYRNVHSYDQLLCGFLEGFGCFWLVTSLREYLIWFREDYIGKCSMLGLFFNPVLNAFNGLVALGMYVQFTCSKPIWHLQMENVCKENTIDSD